MLDERVRLRVHRRRRRGAPDELRVRLGVRLGRRVRRRVEQHAQRLGHLRLDAEVGLAQQQLNERVRERRRAAADLPEDERAHERRVVVDERNEDFGAGNAHSRLAVAQRVRHHAEHVVLQEAAVQRCARLRLDVLGDGTALLDEEHGVGPTLIAAAAGLVRGGTEDAKELLDDGRVAMQMLDDVDVVKEDDGIKNGEGGVVEDAREHDILEVL